VRHERNFTTTAELIAKTIIEIRDATDFNTGRWDHCVYAKLCRAADVPTRPFDPINHGAALLGISKVDAMRLFSTTPVVSQAADKAIAMHRLQRLARLGTVGFDPHL
jgi:hypothetical protein